MTWKASEVYAGIKRIQDSRSPWTLTIGTIGVKDGEVKITGTRAELQQLVSELDHLINDYAGKVEAVEARHAPKK